MVNRIRYVSFTIVSVPNSNHLHPFPCIHNQSLEIRVTFVSAVPLLHGADTSKKVGSLLPVRYGDFAIAICLGSLP